MFVTYDNEGSEVKIVIGSLGPMRWEYTPVGSPVYETPTE